MVEYLDPIEEKKDSSSVQVREAGYDHEQAYERSPVQRAALDEYDDPNLDPDAIGDYEDDSPYPEVRAAVANTDDTNIPVNTFRSWVIGLMWAILIPGLNQYVFYVCAYDFMGLIYIPHRFFFFRYPSVTIGPLVAQLLSFPLGRFFAAVLPDVKILGVRLNPGPFTIKEHVLITIMASVGAGSAYATDVVAVQRVYYHQTWNFSYQWLITMSTQLIGFSIGGIARRFLVSPPSMSELPSLGLSSNTDDECP